MTLICIIFNSYLIHKKEFGESLMKVIDEQDVTYCNFINSLDSEYTKKYYKFCLVCDHVEKHKKEQSKGSEKENIGFYYYKKIKSE
jgi:hypothetical protein